VTKSWLDDGAAPKKFGRPQSVDDHNNPDHHQNRKTRWLRPAPSALMVVSPVSEFLAVRRRLGRTAGAFEELLDFGDASGETISHRPGFFRA